MAPLQSRLSVFGTLGGGVWFFHRAGITRGNVLTVAESIHGVLGIGGGMDVRLSRFISIRVDVRDYVSGRDLSGVPGRNHWKPMFGFVFHN